MAESFHQKAFEILHSVYRRRIALWCFRCVPEVRGFRLDEHGVVRNEWCRNSWHRDVCSVGVVFDLGFDAGQRGIVVP